MNMQVPADIGDILSYNEVLQHNKLWSATDKNLLNGRKISNVLVISDIGKDYDDIVAILVLKELYKVCAIDILGIIVNSHPEKLRARFARGLLDNLMLSHIPVVAGTPGTDKLTDPYRYEFDCDFIVSEDSTRIRYDGEEFIKECFENAVRSGNKITLLLISSLRDIDNFSHKYPNLFRSGIDKVSIQGGCTISDGTLVPLSNATNNALDKAAADRFYSILSGIPTIVYTKLAAYDMPLRPEFLDKLAIGNHPVAKHLRYAQLSQDYIFYEWGSREPAKRYLPFMDCKWFLNCKTSWFNSHNKDDPYPSPENIKQWVNKIIVYDALAAVSTCDKETLNKLNVIKWNETENDGVHYIVGTSQSSGINRSNMRNTITGMMKMSTRTDI